MTTTFRLQNMTDLQYPDVVVHEWDIMKYIGRNKESQIMDLRISRQQLVLRPVFEQKKLEVKSIGVAECSINGQKMILNEWYDLRDDGLLQFNENYRYRVKYEDTRKYWGQIKFPYNNSVNCLYESEVRIGRLPTVVTTDFEKQCQLLLLTENDVGPKIFPYISKHHITIEMKETFAEIKNIATSEITVNNNIVKQGEIAILSDNSKILLSKFQLFEFSYLIPDGDEWEWEDD